MSKRKIIFFLISAVLAIATVYFILPWRILVIKQRVVIVEVARTPQQRAQGLQGKTFLGKNLGMLFVFEEEGYPAFWMKDTLIALDIAFINKDKKIVDIQQMMPLDTRMRYIPRQRVLYALEMNYGWFKNNNVKTEDRVLAVFDF